MLVHIVISDVVLSSQLCNHCRSYSLVCSCHYAYKAIQLPVTSIRTEMVTFRFHGQCWWHFLKVSRSRAENLIAAVSRDRKNGRSQTTLSISIFRSPRIFRFHVWGQWQWPRSRFFINVKRTNHSRGISDKLVESEERGERSFQRTAAVDKYDFPYQHLSVSYCWS